MWNTIYHFCTFEITPGKIEPLNPPLLARTRRNDRSYWRELWENAQTAPEEYDDEEYDEEERVDRRSSSFHKIFASTNFIVENSFQIAPDDSEPEILENRPEVWDRDTKFLSVSDQILYLDNRNLIVLDYKPTYENNKP